MRPIFPVLGRLFSPEGFVPPGIYGTWTGWPAWEQLAGNVLVGIACVAMMLIVWRLGSSRPDWPPFKGVVRACAAFIGLFGLGHFLDLLALYRPMGGLSGHVLVATGLAACWAAWALGREWPAFMAMKSPAELEAVIAQRTAELTGANVELRRAEVDRAYLATIVESSDDAIMSKDLDGVVTSWNQGAERLFGYTAGEAVGRPMTFLFPADRLDEESAILERLRSGERVDHFESVRLTKDGRAIDVSITISPVKDPTGRIVGISKIARNITEMKRAQEADRASLATIVESSDDAIVGKDLDGVVTSWNGGAERLFGYTAAEAIGRPMTFLFPPDNMSEEAGILERLRRGEKVDHFESVRLTKAGRLIDVSIAISPIRDHAGRIVGSSKIARDITGRKDAEAQIRLLNEGLEARVGERTAELTLALENFERAENYAQNIVDTVREPLLMLDSTLRVRSANRAFYQSFHVSPGETEGRLIYELGNGQWDIPDLRTLLDDIVPKSSVFDDFELEHTFPTIGRRVMLLNARKLQAGNHDELLVLAMEDVTERRLVEEEVAKAKEAAEAASRAKSAFLANMSHEIRTPMNGVIGMTELLLDTPLSDLQRNYARTVHSSGEALLTVINDILDFSKIEAGRLTLEPVEFDLRKLMDELADLLAPVAIRKDLKLDCHVAREVPRRLVGDPVRIRQILTNLAGNAVKFTERGRVDLEAHLLAGAGDRATLRILVRDTGIGIPADRQADIFESFTQIEGGSSRPHGGTGLGLTICRSLAGLMGGRIGVESGPGEGSTFWFEVTLGKGADDADLPPARLDGLRVLVVDDQEADREALRGVLLSWQCRPEVAASGAEALTRLLAETDEDPFVLIVLDQDMPGMDGEQTARVIKAMPRHARVPIVLLAAAGPVESEAVEGDLWAARMAKPVRRSLLYNTLCRTIESPGLLHARPPAVDPGGMKLALPLCILLAEDNEVNREVAIGMVERLGCRVETAWNGREAVELLDYGRHDVILMDVQMPEMDGFTATAAIRDRERETGRHMPIIALTAHAMEGDRARCLAAGMDDYLSKPIRPGPLLEALRAWGGKAEAAPVEPTPIEAVPRREPGIPSPFGEALRVSCGDDPKLIRKVVELMLKGVPVRLGRLEAAILARDGARVSGEAHSLKGAFATVGAGALAVACRDLMALGKGDDPAAIERVHRLVREQWSILKEEASRYLETLRP